MVNVEFQFLIQFTYFKAYECICLEADLSNHIGLGSWSAFQYSELWATNSYDCPCMWIGGASFNDAVLTVFINIGFQGDP